MSVNQSNSNISRKKKILFSFTLLILLVVSFEVALRVVYYQKKAGYSLALIHGYHSLKYRLLSLASTEELFERNLYKKDPVLGYSIVPGIHSLGIRWRLIFSRIWNFTATIDEEGYRTTSENPQQYGGKDEIWIFGGSFTWGWPLDNNRIYPWLLQERLEKFRVYNFGVNGYGNVQALLQLKRRISNHSPPRICIFVFNPELHLSRNVAAPSRLAQFKTLHDMDFQHPRAFIDKNGELAIELVPLKPVDGSDPDIIYMQRTTMMIFKEIKRICDTYNVVTVLAFQTGPKGDPVIQFCKKIGFKIVDMYVNLVAGYSMLPVDGHPNQKAHKLYAHKLWAGIRNIVGQAQ